ncbi:MAG: hypothetical protein LBC43_03175 [Bifidobacteriaceae bacterium]|jgi:hypothetical protein|nr:hypothetical protein [Bifidobacteriaceae bacterium]
MENFKSFRHKSIIFRIGSLSLALVLVGAGLTSVNFLPNSLKTLLAETKLNFEPLSLTVTGQGSNIDASWSAADITISDVTTTRITIPDSTSSDSTASDSTSSDSTASDSTSSDVTITTYKQIHPIVAAVKLSAKNSLKGFPPIQESSETSFVDRTQTTGTWNLLNRFAGKYLFDLTASVAYSDGTSSIYDRTATHVIPLVEKTPLASVSFPDVSTQGVSVTYTLDGKSKTSKLPGLTAGRVESIKWLSGYNITVGSGSGHVAAGVTKTTYRPQDPVNRGSMAQFLQKLAGFTDYQIESIYKDRSNPFIDIVKFRKGGSAENLARFYAILWLADTKITVGCDVARTKYCPDNPVNRGAMAEFMQKFAGVQPVSESTSPFPDVSPVQETVKYDGYNQTTRVAALPLDKFPYRIGAINWLASTKITVGSGKTVAWGKFNAGITTFRPHDVVNRGSMAQFMHKLSFSVGSTVVQPS